MHECPIMNCDNIIKYLDAYSDATLSPVEALPVRRHVEECRACAARLRELSDLKSALAQLPVPEPAPATLERLLAAAVQAPQLPARRGHRRDIWQKAGLAAAACLLLAIGFVVGVAVTGRKTSDAPAQVALAAEPIQVGPTAENVSLMFRTADPLHDASISVWLPDDVQIAGRPHVHYVSWHTDLKAGSNLLELPLQSTGPNGGTLVVRLSQGSMVKTLEIPISVRSSKGPQTGALYGRDGQALT